MQPKLLPDPPIWLSVDPANDRIVLTVMASLMALAALFAVLQGIRTRRPVVALMFMAGGCMMLMEPLVDTVAGCWFASNSTIAYTGYGRPIPTWVCLTYFVYFGLGGGVIWTMMERGITPGQVWLFYLGEVVTDIVLETVLLRTHLYAYYGHQPLLFGNFPLWWAAVNALISLSAAAVTFAVARRLDGIRLVILVPALLSTSAAVNAAAGWPAWFVINTDVGPALTQAGGGLSVLIALFMVSLVAKLVAMPAATAGETIARDLRAA